MAPEALTRSKFIILWCRICTESCTFNVSLNAIKMGGIHCQFVLQRESKKSWAYSVFAFIAPAIGGTHIAIPFNSLSTTTPQSLIFRFDTFTSAIDSHALHFGAFIVVWYETTPVGVFDFKVAFVTPYTVETRRGYEIGEEAGESGKFLWTWWVGG